MSVVLACCQNEPYLGMDAQCTKQATICLTHSPHTDKKGVLHNIMPLSHFRRTVNELKFQMIDKVANLTDQYSAFMDLLLSQIADLKARKVIELGTLWLRELSSSQQEYEQLKRIFRNDFDGFSCRQIHNFYEKITHTHQLQQEKLQNIPAYEGICQVMDNLSKSVKSRLLITERLTNLEGVLEKGQLLKKALPELKIMQDGGKQILLDDKNTNYEVRYNRAEMKSSSKGYQSVLSKYPLIPLSNYFVKVNCKYTNFIIGVARQSLKASSYQDTDLHYNQHSLTYNCSNGYIYRDGMFESNQNNLLKGKKSLDLVVQVTSVEMLVMTGKNLICRTALKQFQGKHLYLHVLMRTKGDNAEISIHSDQQVGQQIIPDYISDHINQSMSERVSQVQSVQSIKISGQTPQLLPSEDNINYKEQEDDMIKSTLGKAQQYRTHRSKQPSFFVQKSPIYESQYQPKEQEEDSYEMTAKDLGKLAKGPLIESINDKLEMLRPAELKAERSKVMIKMDNSQIQSEANPSSRQSKYRKQSSRIIFDQAVTGSLTNTQLDDKFSKMIGGGANSSKRTRYLGIG